MYFQATASDDSKEEPADINLFRVTVPMPDKKCAYCSKVSYAFVVCLDQDTVKCGAPEAGGVRKFS